MDVKSGRKVLIGRRPTPTDSTKIYNNICPDCQARYLVGDMRLDGWIDITRCSNCEVKGGRYVHWDELNTRNQYNKKKLSRLASR
jgi:hypothetical protein